MISSTCTNFFTSIGKVYLHAEPASASILRFNGLRTLTSDPRLSKLILYIHLLNVCSQLLLPVIFPIFATQQFRRHFERQLFFTSLKAMRICSELRYRILTDPWHMHEFSYLRYRFTNTVQHFLHPIGPTDVIDAFPCISKKIEQTVIAFHDWFCCRCELIYWYMGLMMRFEKT